MRGNRDTIHQVSLIITGATFFFLFCFVFLLLLLFSALPFSSFVCDSTVGRHRLAIGV